MIDIKINYADSVEILSLMDNSFDLLMQSTENVHRYPFLSDALEKSLPIAEHGFSALIDIKFGSSERRLLFDTGVSINGLIYNLNALKISPDTIDAIVVSHGHTDHVMGLLGILKQMGRKKTPLILHPDSYLERKLILPNGIEVNIPQPKRKELLDQNIELIESIGPSMLFDDISLISGEISRTTEFETGLPNHFSKKNGKWVADPLISDDQCLIVNVRNKGLVVITGCGHAGIINIIKNAQAITGELKIFFVMGGFHLGGPVFEKIIPLTINELEKLDPKFIVPSHCTGWKATHEIARILPNSFVPNSVGTRFVI
jgi:7,8-dihydropterin-6-yl-methyl-4-(beta-D-ribofuranosyl)aminobenzene 5'-phosphate synthase